jgi:hypothetical protein
MTAHLNRLNQGPLAPREGFDWMAVSWGGPSEPITRTCSYCEANIDEDDVPMIMWTNQGFCARFCVACQSRWWGLV